MKTSKFKMTEIGEIPADWEVKRLGDVCEKIRNGYGYDFREQGIYPMSRIETISSGEINYQRVVKIAEEPPVEYRLKVGDILYSHINSLPYIGNIAQYDGKEILYHGMNLLLLRPIEKVDSVYLKFLLKSEPMRNMAKSVAKVAINQASISTKELAQFPLVVPPLAEQKAIAEALSDVDALIAAQEELIEKKRAIKQGAMQELITGKKRLPGFGGKCRQESLETEDFNAEAQRRRGSECKMTEVGLIPVDWKGKRLGDVGSFSKGAGISRAQANSGKIPAVRYGELYTTHHNYIKRFESFISDEVAKESTQLTYGDIVFACSGETKEEIGKCAAFLGSEVAYAGGDLIILSPRTGYDSKFLAFELNAPYCALQKAAAGQGDAVVHIRRESLENLIVVVPSLAEQKAIAEVLSDMDAEIGELEAQKAKFESIKQGMMQELLTGKIRLV